MGFVYLKTRLTLIILASTVFFYPIPKWGQISLACFFYLLTALVSIPARKKEQINFDREFHQVMEVWDDFLREDQRIRVLTEIPPPLRQPTNDWITEGF